MDTKHPCILEKCIYFFRLLGNNVGKHPLIYITVVIVTSFIMSSGIFQMKYNNNLDYLFSSETGKAIQSQKKIERLYPINTSLNTDLLRMTKRKHIIMIIATPIDNENIFRNDIFNELQIIENLVQNIKVKFNTVYANYSILCGKKNGNCIKNEIFNLYPYLKLISNGKYKIAYPYEINPISHTVTTYMENFGGVSTDDKGYIKEVKAARLVYVLDTSDSTKENVLKEWELTLIQELKQTVFKNIYVSFLTSHNVELEIKQLTDFLLPKSLIVLGIIAVFSMITCLNGDWITSKPWLGICGCFSSVLALISSFGFLFYCGVDYIDINIAIPYLILGTEIDDAYVLIATWRRTDPEDDVPKRLSDVYSENAVSITITSLTNFSSYCLGTIAPFPVVRIFCIYAATSVLFCYCYQITFFGSFIALSGYREKQLRHALTFHVIKRKNYIREKKKEDIITVISSKLTNILCRNSIKISILLLGILNLSLAINGLFYIIKGTKPTDVFSRSTTTNIYTKMHYKYFSRYSYPVQIIINEKLNYANVTVQNSIENTLRSFENHPKIADSHLTVSWLKYYKYFINTNIGKYLTKSYDINNETDFIYVLRNIFLKFPQTADFKSDILFDANGTEIISSRFIVICKELERIEDEFKLFKDLQDIKENAKFPVIVYNMLFHVFEQAFLISGITIQIAWMTALLMMIIFFIFITDLKTSICVALSILLIICEVIGQMAIWNVRLDMLSLLVLILSIGFSINYPTHITYAFMTTNSDSNCFKLKNAIHKVGWPIFQGTTSTILSVIIFAFEDTYVFVTFFKIIFLVAVNTGFHAIFLLPIVLYYII